ncbi:hypothetical protein BC828DRAFT_388046 [Blastocladiella britannica]|nr:hypothetical protein BC828DRAFT_388046 [Blastocladiella britannica]
MSLLVAGVLARPRAVSSDAASAPRKASLVKHIQLPPPPRAVYDAFALLFTPLAMVPMHRLDPWLLLTATTGYLMVEVYRAAADPPTYSHSSSPGDGTSVVEPSESDTPAMVTCRRSQRLLDLIVEFRLKPGLPATQFMRGAACPAILAPSRLGADESRVALEVLYEWIAAGITRAGFLPPWPATPVPEQALAQLLEAPALSGAVAPVHLFLSEQCECPSLAIGGSDTVEGAALAFCDSHPHSDHNRGGDGTESIAPSITVTPVDSMASSLDSEGTAAPAATARSTRLPSVSVAPAPRRNSFDLRALLRHPIGTIRSVLPARPSWAGHASQQQQQQRTRGLPSPPLLPPRLDASPLSSPPLLPARSGALAIPSPGLLPTPAIPPYDDAGFRSRTSSVASSVMSTSFPTPASWARHTNLPPPTTDDIEILIGMFPGLAVIDLEEIDVWADFASDHALLLEIYQSPAEGRPAPPSYPMAAALSESLAESVAALSEALTGSRRDSFDTTSTTTPSSREVGMAAIAAAAAAAVTQQVSSRHRRRGASRRSGSGGLHTRSRSRPRQLIDAMDAAANPSDTAHDPDDPAHVARPPYEVMQLLASVQFSSPVTTGSWNLGPAMPCGFASDLVALRRDKVGQAEAVRRVYAYVVREVQAIGRDAPWPAMEVPVTVATTADRLAGLTREIRKAAKAGRRDTVERLRDLLADVCAGRAVLPCTAAH